MDDFPRGREASEAVQGSARRDRGAKDKKKDEVSLFPTRKRERDGDDGYVPFWTWGDARRDAPCSAIPRADLAGSKTSGTGSRCAFAQC